MGLKLSRHYPIVHQFDEDAIQDRNPYFIVFATGIQGWRPSTARLDGKSSVLTTDDLWILQNEIKRINKE